MKIHICSFKWIFSYVPHYTQQALKGYWIIKFLRLITSNNEEILYLWWAITFEEQQTITFIKDKESDLWCSCIN